MFRRLRENDREMVMEMLNQDTLIHIGRISTVRLFGLDSDEFVLYGEFDEEKLVSLITNYKSIAASYYSEGKRDILEAIELIRGLEWKSFSGRKELILPFKPFLDHQRTYESFLSVARQFDCFDLTEFELTTMTTEEELQELMNLLFQIDEFEALRLISKEKAIAEMRENYFEFKDGLFVYLRKEGKIVAMAGSMLENDEYAYITSVATLPSERKKGYATVVVKYLMNEYNNMNKKLCLNYDNLEAAKIYHRLGFVDQDESLVLIRE